MHPSIMSPQNFQVNECNFAFLSSAELNSIGWQCPPQNYFIKCNIDAALLANSNSTETGYGYGILKVLLWLVEHGLFWPYTIPLFGLWICKFHTSFSSQILRLLWMPFIHLATILLCLYPLFHNANPFFKILSLLVFALLGD